ncbi:MBL fold metallo-hydrolase [Dethiothermospora halolimnae]|uniref:MBL fold metallo-hydrolase n=1 Tax=Dethiothermospora halolimnae TaxID=3114390 RepID=UPI003CCC42DE
MISSNLDLHIQYIGNSGFYITDDNNHIYIDYPYTSGSYGYMEYDPNLINHNNKSICFITHSHRDHWNRREFNKYSWKIFGPRDITFFMKRFKILKAKDLKSIGIEMKVIKTPHKYCIFHNTLLFKWKDITFYVSGDTTDISHLVDLEDIDIAFVNPWILKELNRQGKCFKAKHVILCHLRDEDLEKDFFIDKNYIVMKQYDVLNF